MTKIVLADTLSGYNLARINENFEKVQNALNNEVLYRDNPEGEANQMQDLLDMNGKRIINLPSPQSPNDAARYGDIPLVPIPIGTTTALLTTFTPTGGISSTNAQAAIEEVATDIRNELITSSSGAGGAGMVGYNGLTSYPTNTVGSKLAFFITPEEFGAVGDGVTNDTVAIQAFYTHLAANGGMGFLGRKTYLITSQITLSTFTRGFMVIGSGSESVIRLRASSAVSAFGFINPTGVIHQDFRIDCGYTVTTFASHGMSFRNANKCVWRNIEVYDFRNSAILTFVDADDTYGDNHIINCTAYGNSVGQNGFLHEGMLRSSIQQCTVKDLNTAGSPCVGLQLKNRCKHSWIEGGFASGCKSGVALGGDGATFGDGPFNCWIRGTITKDCLDGATIGKSTDCVVEIFADQTNSPTPGTLTGYALNVAGANLNFSAVVRIKGVNSGRTCILVRSDDVNIFVPYVNGIGSKLLEMSAGVDRCRVIVEDIADAVTNINDYVTDNSGTTTNEILFLRDLPGGGLTGSNFIKLPTPGKAQNWMSFNGSTETFNFRINGVDRLSLNNTSLLPQPDVSMSCGSATRRFTNVFSQGLALVDGITAPSAITNHAVIYVDSADGDLKIKFADGVTKTIATDT